MKDTRSSLDAVRRLIPPNAKLLVVWQAAEGGPLHCSQSNLSMGDIGQLADSLKANVLMAEKKVG